jgi:hypothetical protein
VNKPHEIMKSKMLFFVAIIASAALISCSEDDEKTLKGDPDITHEGDKWTITSINYTLIDQSTSGGVGQTFKTGSEGTGAFYFVEDQLKGSFEMRIADYNKEDYFSYSFPTEGEVRIFTVDQSVGTTTNQNIIAVSGPTTETERSLSGTIIKQSTQSGQFLLEFDAVVQKEQ